MIRAAAAAAIILLTSISGIAAQSEALMAEYESEIITLSSQFEYSVQPEMTVRIVGFGGSGEVGVPDKIGGYSVTGVGTEAFMNSGVTKVTLPEGVVFVGSSAFQGCGELEAVKLPESLKEIGTCCFCGCMKLKQIVIPKNVTYIGDGAFGRNDDETGELCSRSDIVLFGEEGSYAQEYAMQNNIQFFIGTPDNYRIPNEFGSDTDSDGGTPQITITPTKLDSAARMAYIGDVDGDTFITSADALAVLRISAGIGNATAEEKTVCDINGDGFITAGDALDILRSSAGLSASERIGSRI